MAFIKGNNFQGCTGFLAYDTEVKTVGATELAKNTVVVKDSYMKAGERKEIVEFIKIKAWGNVAKILGSIPKNSFVQVTGKCSTDKKKNEETGVVTYYQELEVIDINNVSRLFEKIYENKKEDYNQNQGSQGDKQWG